MIGPPEIWTKAQRAAMAGTRLDTPPPGWRRIPATEIDPEVLLIFGLDGDDTGTALEQLFLSAREEAPFRRLSMAVTRAIEAVRQLIEDEACQASIIFAAGDDILFTGRCSETFVRQLQRTYTEVSEGLTCSVGFGRSFQEVYLALKLAKSDPGKNSIAGASVGF